MDKIDYSNYHSEPMVSLNLTDTEYQKRLKLRLAMEDIIKAHIECYSTDNSRDIQDSVFADRVNEIIEGWEFEK